MLGEIFGRLTIVSEADSIGKNKAWSCKCVCGNMKIVRQYSLKNGDTTSCGCYHKEQTSNKNSSHKMTNTKTYHSWQSMKSRCFDMNTKDYSNYGGRGITVCDRWLESFENFYEDMGECPDKLTLHRIDNDKGYFKENCKWEIKSVQAFVQRMKSNNTSGKTGVYWVGKQNKWRSIISYKNKVIHLGYFCEFREAVKAREEAELKYFGEIKC